MESDRRSDDGLSDDDPRNRGRPDDDDLDEDGPAAPRPQAPPHPPRRGAPWLPDPNAKPRKCPPNNFYTAYPEFDNLPPVAAKQYANTPWVASDPHYTWKGDRWETRGRRRIGAMGENQGPTPKRPREGDPADIPRNTAHMSLQGSSASTLSSVAQSLRHFDLAGLFHDRRRDPNFAVGSAPPHLRHINPWMASRLPESSPRDPLAFGHPPLRSAQGPQPPATHPPEQQGLQQTPQEQPRTARPSSAAELPPAPAAFSWIVPPDPPESATPAAIRRPFTLLPDPVNDDQEMVFDAQPEPPQQSRPRHHPTMQLRQRANPRPGCSPHPSPSHLPPSPSLVWPESTPPVPAGGHGATPSPGTAQG